MYIEYALIGRRNLPSEKRLLYRARARSVLADVSVVRRCRRYLSSCLWWRALVILCNHDADVDVQSAHASNRAGVVNEGQIEINVFCCFAGDVSGCAGIVVGYPFDTVKVHIQTQDYRNPKYRGTWHCFRTLLAQESVSFMRRIIGLWPLWKMYTSNSTPRERKRSYCTPNVASTRNVVVLLARKMSIICAILIKVATKPEITIWKLFFEHTFGVRFFLFIIEYKMKIRSCTTSIKWTTFSWTTSYFLRKC